MSQKLHLTVQALLLMAMVMPMHPTEAQPVSGVWKGRVGNQALGMGRSYQVELKILRDGDSLRGVSYYRTMGNNHVRIPVKGYFNPFDGTVTWWHDARTGVDDKGRQVADLLPAGLTFSTDFNCPDGTTLKLDGNASMSTWSGRTWDMPVHLQKAGEADFSDEWDRQLVSVENVNEPSKPATKKEPPPSLQEQAKPEPLPVVRTEPPLQKAPEPSPAQKPIVRAEPPSAPKEQAKPEPPPVVRTEPPIQKVPVPSPAPKPIVRAEPPPATKEQAKPEPPPVVRTEPPIQKVPESNPAPKPIVRAEPAPPSKQATTIDTPLRNPSPETNPVAPIPPTVIPDADKPTNLFNSRDKKLVEEIEVIGDTLWLNFYDHAQEDGDSISIFLDNKLLASNILLKITPHTLGIPLADLGESTELTMVAENLGSIPPNTALLVVYVDGVRHEAQLESTEKTSAMIRFRKLVKK